ncbi:MAG: PHB depolymerase family esterase [Planctomycetota bacterium]
MNRLPTLSSDALGFDSHSLDGSRCGAPEAAPLREELQRTTCSIFTPLHYEQGYAYPLLVWLHGDGGSERELRRVMPHVSVRNYVAIAARGADSNVADETSFYWQDSATGSGDAADEVRRCIDLAASRYHLHAERIFIAGYQSGGTMALRLALRYPDWFAGAASIGGAMPRGDSPLRRVNHARRLPLLLTCCRECRQYPPQRVADDLRLLHSAGFSLALRQYPGDSGLTTAMLGDLDRWLMGLICPESSQATL